MNLYLRDDTVSNSGGAFEDVGSENEKRFHVEPFTGVDVSNVNSFEDLVVGPCQGV